MEDECEEGVAAELPYWKCEYCNIHTPAAVVKCCATGKWFCNYKPPGLPASCIVYHLVRSKHNEVMLHKESPLGEITLECFLTGAKNVFQLGFVPVKEDLVVLLARDTEVSRSEYDWDLSKWAPLVQVTNVFGLRSGGGGGRTASAGGEASGGRGEARRLSVY